MKGEYFYCVSTQGEDILARKVDIAGVVGTNTGIIVYFEPGKTPWTDVETESYDLIGFVSNVMDDKKLLETITNDDR